MDPAATPAAISPFSRIELRERPRELFGPEPDNELHGPIYRFTEGAVAVVAAEPKVSHRIPRLKRLSMESLISLWRADASSSAIRLASIAGSGGAGSSSFALVQRVPVP